MIGAGTAGLSAAHHLRNFGYKVGMPICGEGFILFGCVAVGDCA